MNIKAKKAYPIHNYFEREKEYIKSKRIFLLDYGFNVENFLGQIFPKKHIFEKYGEYNEIIISSVYSSLVYPEE